MTTFVEYGAKDAQAELREKAYELARLGMDLPSLVDTLVKEAGYVEPEKFNMGSATWDATTEGVRAAMSVAKYAADESLRALGVSEQARRDALGIEPVETAAPWSWENVVELGAEPPAPPAISGMFYLGALHLLSGEFDAGKSWAALWAASSEVIAGHPVVWIDTDGMGPSLILERLRLLDVPDDVIEERFLYVRPSGSAPEESVALVTSAIEDGARLVVVDSFNSALSEEGLDPVSTPDVDRFFSKFSKVWQRAGAAVVILDHLPKAKDTSRRYAFGSQRKTTGADVHLAGRNVDTFKRDQGGSMKITAEKDRPGFHGTGEPVGIFTLTTSLSTHAPGRVVYVGAIVEDKTEGADGMIRRTRLMERVSRFIEEADEPPSRRAILGAIEAARAEYVREAIEALVAEGFAEDVPGPRRAKCLRSLRPYREDEDRTGRYGEDLDAEEVES